MRTETTSSTPVGISHGYAPIEQYTPGGVKSFSPQTDIYALGATLYYLVTGSTPPNASELFATDVIGLPANLSDEVRETIRQAMQPKLADRPKSVEEFLHLLDKKANSTEETQVPSSEDTKPYAVEEADSSNRPSPYRKILIGLLLAIVACFGIYYLTTDSTEKIYAKAEKAYNEQSYETAFKLYQKAAEQGYVPAQYNLGLMYDTGEGGIKNSTIAAEWYQKAAEQGYAEAQRILGDKYQYGIGVTKNYEKAIEWYHKAAEQGNTEAQSDLGAMYANGEGVTKDYIKAAEWYRKAAEQGNARAQFNLGVMYDYGEGVTQDDEKAVEWYRKAAEQGYARAQCYLGYMYAHGEGVTKDAGKAVEWYRKAAEQGFSFAQNALDALGK